jgi:carboxymethylenebutenolidase
MTEIKDTNISNLREVEMAEQSYDRILALPSSGRGAGVLVLHAWWGLNDFFRDFCHRLAQDGFVALAPDLFSGKVAQTVEEAEQHLSQFDEAQVVPPIVLSALDDLSRLPQVTSKGIGVIGFSLGAYWALWLAQQKPELVRAVTVFYGTDGGDGDFQQSNAAFLGHFAEADPYESADSVKALENNLRSANRPTTIHTYPETGHWFFENDRPEAYQAQAAQLAWNRTADFFHEQLEDRPSGAGPLLAQFRSVLDKWSGLDRSRKPG